MKKKSGLGMAQYKEGIKTGHEMPSKPSTKQAKGFVKTGNSGKATAGKAK
jgi:hypothetical protein